MGNYMKQLFGATPSTAGIAVLGRIQGGQRVAIRCQTPLHASIKGY